jgi:hypothetical protein
MTAPFPQGNGVIGFEGWSPGKEAYHASFCRAVALWEGAIFRAAIDDDDVYMRLPLCWAFEI